MLKRKIKTKFGTATINCDGYYEISSVKEGNHDKILHRLIYEDFYNVKLPSNVHVHHHNRNKLDNCVFNLRALPAKDHASLHHTGLKLSLESRVKMSKSRNTSNYYRVTREKDLTCKQGFIYNYQYYKEDGTRKKIKSVDINKLKEKVISKGLAWIEFKKEEEIGGEVV